MEYEKIASKSSDELFAIIGALALTQVTQSHEEGTLERQLTGRPEDRNSAAYRFGVRVFSRISKKLHTSVCSGDNKDLHQKLSAARDVGVVSIASILVAGMADFGISVAIATIVATIISKALIESVSEEICSTWDMLNQSINTQ